MRSNVRAHRWYFWSKQITIIEASMFKPEPVPTLLTSNTFHWRKTTYWAWDGIHISVTVTSIRCDSGHFIIELHKLPTHNTHTHTTLSDNGSAVVMMVDRSSKPVSVYGRFKQRSCYSKWLYNAAFNSSGPKDQQFYIPYLRINWERKLFDKVSRGGEKVREGKYLSHLLQCTECSRPPLLF